MKTYALHGNETIQERDNFLKLARSGGQSENNFKDIERRKVIFFLIRKIEQLRFSRFSIAHSLFLFYNECTRRKG